MEQIEINQRAEDVKLFITQNELIEKAEDVANQILKKILRHGHIIRYLARFCFSLTFFEAGFAMYFKWSDEKDYIDSQWGCGSFVATLFVVVHIVGQVAGCFLILTRKKVEIVFRILIGIITLKIIAYGTLWELLSQLFNSLPLIVGLLLLLTRSRQEARSIFLDLPSLDHQNIQKVYAELVALFVSVIISILSFEITHKFEINVLVLVALLTFVGNKLKLSALIMVSLYIVINVFENSFWMEPLWEVTHDLLRHKFFRNMTVIGGLLLVLA